MKKQDYIAYDVLEVFHLANQCLKHTHAKSKSNKIVQLTIFQDL